MIGAGTGRNGGAQETGRSPEQKRAWHALERAGVESVLGTGEGGLAGTEVERRLDRYGPNRREEAPPPSALGILLNRFRSPLIYVLFAAAAVTFLLGAYIDTAAIAAVLLLNAVVGLVRA